MKIKLVRPIRLLLNKKHKKKLMSQVSLIFTIAPLLKPKPFKTKSLKLELRKSLEPFHTQETLEAGN